MVRFLCAIVCLALVSSCGAPQPDTTTARRRPIMNGSPAVGPAYDPVVALRFSVSQGQAMCSGTLIAPRVVLTAAHCAYDPDTEQVLEPSVYTVFFGPDVDEVPAADRRGVVEVWVHPSYSSSTAIYDIGLLRLDADPPDGVVPIPHLPRRMGLSGADLGVPVEFAGYGTTETGAIGTRLVVENEIECVCQATGDCTPSDCVCPAVPATFCHDFDPGGTCAGDSGGPAIIQRSGNRYVAGITSFGDGACPDANYSYSTVVDVYAAEIEQFMGAGVGTACGRDSDCRSGHCEDGVCCERACAACEVCNLAGEEGSCGPASDGTPCPDGDACNGEEQCEDGACRPGEAIDCDDGIDCTVDACKPAAGCDHQPVGASCDDQNPCTRDICDVQQGCRFEPIEGGLACGVCMVCQEGQCVEDPACRKGGGGGCATGGVGGLWGLVAVLLVGVWRRVW